MAVAFFVTAILLLAEAESLQNNSSRCSFGQSDSCRRDQRDYEGRALKANRLVSNPLQDSVGVRRHYAKAPILEAVIDFRVSGPPDVPLDALKTQAWGASGEFPSCEGMRQEEVRVGGGREPAFSAKDVGFRLTSEDKRRVLQVGGAGFTFSRLPPYVSWEPHCEEARRLWANYVVARRPELVTRVAVRYINRLELPLPLDDFKRYLRNVPEVSSELPQGLSGFLVQLKIPQVDLPGGMLVLNEGLLDSGNPNVAAILLDIDLFQTAQYSPDGDELWSALEVLHTRKNDVFEASITDATRDLIR